VENSTYADSNHPPEAVIDTDALATVATSVKSATSTPDMIPFLIIKSSFVVS
jgi:hypothetical protein